jgi:FixJ family two-component response regulator
LPDGTGVDVARDLLRRSSEVRILFMSGYGRLSDTELRGTGGGTVPTQLDKPVDMERLLAWVAEAIGHGTTAPARR